MLFYKIKKHNLYTYSNTLKDFNLNKDIYILLITRKTFGTIFIKLYLPHEHT